MPQPDTIVLISGGLDSAVLLAHQAREGLVHPVYVSVGLAWEASERRMLDRLLSTAPFTTGVAPLARLELSMRDIYAPTHWAITGHPPAYDTPDEDVYLVGRNLTLLTKAGAMAATKRASRIVLGTLAANPFPDARPEFFAAMSRALSLGLDRPIEIATPFAGLHKEEVIQVGTSLGVPLELTLSCMNPILPPLKGVPYSSQSGDGGRSGDDLPLHCGLCSKCRERRDAFAAAGVSDPTPYAAASPR
jgi:7-cyano-7-deazaguanine synthase